MTRCLVNQIELIVWIQHMIKKSQNRKTEQVLRFEYRKMNSLEDQKTVSERESRGPKENKFAY